MDIRKHVQQRDRKIIKGLELLAYQDRLSELGLFSSENKRLGDDLINVYNYVM